MANQPLTVEQVLQDIRTEINRSESTEPGIIGHIEQVRQMQQQFRQTPIIGKLIPLKSVVYSLTHSTFSQQYDLNEAFLDLIEALYYEMSQYQAANNQRLLELQRKLDSVLATNVTNGSETMLSTEASATLAEKPKLPGLNRIYAAPAWMNLPERVTMYSLIYGLKPRYYLEIGTFQGGSAVIVCGAMDDTGYGQLVCVDPNPRLATETWEQIRHRTTLITGNSPEVLPRAAEAVPEKFDFALIDGDHSYEGVLKDVEGILPLLANEAYLLFHDSHYFEIKNAIDDALKKYPNQLSDCGLLSVEQNPQDQFVDGQQVIWGGLRLLRFQRKIN